MTQPSRPALAARLIAELNASSGTPLARQIVDCIWEDVVAGEIETGERLPTVRQLAVDLGVNPKIVERAYLELERLGVMSARAGEGTFVTLSAPDAGVRERYRRLEALAEEAVRGAEELGFSRYDMLDAINDLAVAPESESEWKP